MRRLNWFIVVATFAASSIYAQDISGDCLMCGWACDPTVGMSSVARISTACVFTRPTVT